MHNGSGLLGQTLVAECKEHEIKGLKDNPSFEGFTLFFSLVLKQLAAVLIQLPASRNQAWPKPALEKAVFRYACLLA